jgi:hypothetical protein
MRAVPFSVIGQQAQPWSRWVENQSVATQCAHVISIDKRDQNIDAEQRSHLVDILLTQPIDLLIGAQATPTFKRLEATHSSASRLSGGSGERSPGQLR